MTDPVLLAGNLQTLGNHWLSMFQGWAQPSMEVVGVMIAVVAAVRRFSLKAGLGVLLLLVVCLGVYGARDQLGADFKSEFSGAPAVTGQPFAHLPSGGGE